eukprot:CAMPEP_0206284738 /NCGR_PEP_ID=MMETSP0047_2-20121206/40937_1 /ASSEMBLY_ACC=CAM_ASM_000192 /TAXON_ID=195065 /ORGANISM="Chroomonas mesostigmatica_cf, Strain CCMP1168" /LENGTH=110 /DNA_ID=CAMNT_0053715217 /DNA_START=291 /DNA_END=620 /DNA_ORIENTATION=-
MSGVQPLLRSSVEGANVHMVDLSQLAQECAWASADYKAGDCLIFNCKTVHMGLDNNSDEVRISMDCRSSPICDPVSERQLQPNWDRQTWPEIYAASEWRDKSLQYYWERR